VAAVYSDGKPILMLDSSGAIILSDRPGMGYERNIDALASTRVT
jgi:hypothetical protein